MLDNQQASCSELIYARVLLYYSSLLSTLSRRDTLESRRASQQSALTAHRVGVYTMYERDVVVMRNQRKSKKTLPVFIFIF